MNRIQPSLGVGYLAAVLEREGHEVHIRDTALEGNNHQVSDGTGDIVKIGEPEESIVRYIADLKPDVVGISVVFSNLAEHAHDIARIVKNIRFFFFPTYPMFNHKILQENIIKTQGCHFIF